MPPNTPTPSSSGSVRERDRVPGLRRHPYQRPKPGEDPEVEDDPRLRLLRAHEFAHVPVGDGRDRTGREAHQRRPDLGSGDRGPQQQHAAGEAQQDGRHEAQAQPFARHHRQQQREEHRRRVVERHRGGHRQRRQRVEEHEQRREAGHAAVHVHAQPRGAHREPGMRERARRAGHLHDRAVEHELGGGELLRARLHAHAHQRERQPRRDHPQRLHRR